MNSGNETNMDNAIKFTAHILQVSVKNISSNIRNRVDLDLTTLLTSQVISVTFYSEREKSDKFFSVALISA